MKNLSTEEQENINISVKRSRESVEFAKCLMCAHEWYKLIVSREPCPNCGDSVRVKG